MKVSVVTICFNEEKTIGDTMKSVLNQTYDNFEYIIKDGISQDETNNIVKRIKEKYADKKVKHCICRDEGIYSAMNQAVSECSGEWIVFINAGDRFFDSEVLTNVFYGHNYEEYGVLFGDAVVEKGDIKRVWQGNINRIDRGTPFNHQAAFFRREEMVKNPFDECLRIAADYNNILDLYTNKVLFFNLQMIISVFNMEGISSTNFVERYKEKEWIKKRHGIKQNTIKYEIGMFTEILKTIMYICIPIKIRKLLENAYLNIKYSPIHVEEK